MLFWSRVFPFRVGTAFLHFVSTENSIYWVLHPLIDLSGPFCIICIHSILSDSFDKYASTMTHWCHHEHQRLGNWKKTSVAQRSSMSLKACIWAEQAFVQNWSFNIIIWSGSPVLLKFVLLKCSVVQLG